MTTKSKWIKGESKVLDHFEYIKTTRGRFFGFVCQFRDGDTSYAWTSSKKVGNYKTLDAAKRAIEKLLK